MSFLSTMWHPTLLLFLAITTVPVFLFMRRNDFVEVDAGYRAIFWGSVVISFAAFLDYFEQLPLGEALLQYTMGVSKLEYVVLPYIYMPGIVLLGAGLARWLPTVGQVAAEIERRRKAEASLKEMLEETQALAAQAEAASRTKSEFLATMGHELRTPLNAIIGFSEVLVKDPKHTPERRQEYLGIVMDSGHHLLDIINDLLDMSKLEAGKMIVKPQQFRACQVVEEAISYLEQMASDTGVALSLECPPCDMYSDRRIIKQIVLNLLSNAVKFTPSGGKVDTIVSVEGDDMVITIKDTGVGMTEDELAEAMKPFVQVESSLSRRAPGTGLGLPLVERFCQLLDGSLSIMSEKDKGTTVTVFLPLEIDARFEQQEDPRLETI